MALVVMLVVIAIWMFVSSRLPVIVKRCIVAVVDLAAIVLFAVAAIDWFERVIILFCMVMLALFWVAKDNRFNKDKQIKWNAINVVDMLFVVGVVTITLILDVFK